MLEEQKGNHSSERVILLDSSGVLHRCFHGYSQPRVSNVDGKDMDVAALYGYFEYIRKMTKELEYDILIHVLDPAGGSYKRFSIYPEYKANRSPAHPVLVAQKCLLKPLLEAFGHTCLQINGVESDDVLATLAKRYSDKGDDVLVISSDKDLMQLVKDGKTALARYVEKGGYGDGKTHEFYEEQEVVDKYGILPEQIADWLALVGDVSDNIPGVHKVGGKTATKWLQEYGSLSSIMTHANDIKGKVGENLRMALNKLPLYRELTTVIEDIPIELPPKNVVIDEEKNQWGRNILQAPDYWPNDINSDLRGLSNYDYNGKSRQLTF